MGQAKKRGSFEVRKEQAVNTVAKKKADIIVKMVNAARKTPLRKKIADKNALAIAVVAAKLNGEKE